MRQYRGNLSNFLEYKVWFKVKDIKLESNSKLAIPNDFVPITRRKSLYESEQKLIKFVRLIDVNLELFAKTYCYLSNKSYEALYRIVLKKPQAE